MTVGKLDQGTKQSLEEIMCWSANFHQDHSGLQVIKRLSWGLIQVGTVF